MENFFMGCDWGTSSFRLQLFDIKNQKVVNEIKSDEGIAAMHRAWQQLTTTGKAPSKVEFFREYLKKQVALLSAKSSADLHNITIVISGMASSSIGMEDVPYAALPFALDGSGTALKYFESTRDFPNQIILISGVQSGSDVMRGEETQLIGLVALLQREATIPEEGMLIFPGTHSKHIFIREGKMISFNTFMTGELFSIMSKYSILKDSVQNDEGELSEADVDAFKRGVEKSKEAGILNLLFTVRTNQLFNKLDKKQNSFYLSGLLIGEEMKYLIQEEMPVVVCSASNLAPYYKMAIEVLNLLQRTAVVPAGLVDKAALAGQVLIYKKHDLNKQAK